MIHLRALTEEAVKRDALSEAELGEMIASVPATRKLLLLDTCHAGAMGDAMLEHLAHIEQRANVKKLSGAVGSTVISATNSDQEANEGEDGHGLFTWVLLQGLGGNADVSKHGFIKNLDLAGCTQTARFRRSPRSTSMPRRTRTCTTPDNPSRSPARDEGAHVRTLQHRHLVFALPAPRHPRLVPACAAAVVLGLTAGAAAETQPNTNQRPVIPQRPPPAKPLPRIAMINPNQAKLVQSQNFLGRPGPPGSTEIQAHNGNFVRRTADGQVVDVRNPRTGMVIHHGLDGSRHVSVEGADHSRVYATTRGVSFVQHPYTYNGRVYSNRTYSFQGQVIHQVYRPYPWNGQTLDSYAPTRFYAPQFYHLALTRTPAPFSWQWGYVTNPPPWYGYYRGYFAPESSYNSPVMWLTDYLLAASLAVSYTVEPPRAAAPASSGSPAAAPAAPPAGDSGASVTPEVKQMLAKEVARQVNQEATEAQANSQNRDVPAGSGSIVQELRDRQDHVFVVASDLDLVDQTGRRCSVTEGDVLNVNAGVDEASSTALAVVLSSKGAGACDRAAVVPVPVADLQEMQNHMRAAIDQGLASTPAGHKAPTVTPGFAASAPPPDPQAAGEIENQQKLAAAEG